MQKTIYAFDFDGTLTTGDTLLRFIRYSCGTRAFVTGFMLYAPLLVLMKLHICPNYRVKQRVFAHFFRDMTAEHFDELCRDFARDNRHLLRPGLLDILRQAVADGHRVVIVSASIDNWVAPFFDGILSPLTPTGGEAMSSPHSPLIVVGTKVEISNGRLTGRFSTSNCYGQEKVRRLLEIEPDRSSYRLIAFGDSRGDRELLAMADIAYYKGRLMNR